MNNSDSLFFLCGSVYLKEETYNLIKIKKKNVGILMLFYNVETTFLLLNPFFKKEIVHFTLCMNNTTKN